MRGIFRDQAQLFSYVSPESRVPSGHPLRKIHGLVRDVLSELSRSFARLYAKDGRPSVPPEQLLSALLIQPLYGIRSERQLIVVPPIMGAIADSSGVSESFLILGGSMLLLCIALALIIRRVGRRRSLDGSLAGD